MCFSKLISETMDNVFMSWKTTEQTKVNANEYTYPVLAKFAQ